MKTVWVNFDHQLNQIYKKNSRALPETLILAVSGGLDSMVLLHSFLKIASSKKIVVAYYHHGPSDHPEQLKFRDQSLRFVKDAVLRLKTETGQKLRPVVFEAAQSSQKLISENDMRRARTAFFDKMVAKHQGIVLTAHHSDDWLETVLLKMIRGVGPDKMFSFRERTEKVFRPFMTFPKSELLQYAKAQKINWLEDPSNAQSFYLRNWLRNEWLPQLEKRSSRGSYRFSQSLHRLAEAFQPHSTFSLVFARNAHASGLDRRWFNTLSPSEKSRALALFLNEHNVREFSSGQIKEIIKRLDKNQKELTFTILNRKWVINALQIVLELS